MSRLAAVLCALALTAAACSADTGDEADAGAEEATATTATNTGSDDSADDEAADEEASGEQGVSGELVAPGEQFAPVTVVGESLGDMPAQIPVTDADNDPAVGVVAPDLIGTDFDGTPVAITADGTPRVVMFVAHWCGHCQAEIPAVKALIDEGAVPDGLEIVVVSTAVQDGEPNFPPQDWLEREEWPGPVMRDSPEFDALFAFGAGGFPFTVYLDGEHRVVARSAGQLPEDILQQIWSATAGA